MDNFRIGNHPKSGDLLDNLLVLKQLGYYEHLIAVFNKELTDSMMHLDPDSSEFKALVREKTALVKWLTQLDTEATAELEYRASQQESEGQ